MPRARLGGVFVGVAIVAACSDGTAPETTTTWIRVTAGYHVTCGLTTGGTAHCWGYSWGDDTTDRTIPVAVSGGLVYQAISAGGDHVCALRTDGAAYCGGANAEGQLGDGTTTDRPGPVAVSGGLVFQAISSGGWHTCGLTTGGAAYCWGSNFWSALGDGSELDDRPTKRLSPVAVAGGLVFQAIRGGSLHTCGLTTGGAAYCWGANLFGQVGDGTMMGDVAANATRASPVAVTGGLVFQTISAGGDHTCGLTSAGAAYCWGLNLKGQLGDGTFGTMDQPRTSPVAVSGGLVFQAISTGGEYMCGLTTAGAAYCWGSNDAGQLGDGTAIDRSSPVPVSGGFVFQSISAGWDHSCAVTTAGAAYCWGNNELGLLGDGTIVQRNTPVAVKAPAAAAAGR
jgi:alpha-tubulin suppressor-like RCC1 family protein